MQLTRREFLIAGGMACASSARASEWPPVILAADNAKPLERMALTFCRQCPGGCGLRIRLVNDRVVGVAGNPRHPINRGGVCARAPAAVQTLYNPDRLTTPLELAGPKGSGRYRPVTWEAAVKRIADRLRDNRRSHRAQSLAVMIEGDRGLRRLLWSRFLQAYGSNNLIDTAVAESHTDTPAVRAFQGFSGGIGYDLERAQFVLSFGSQLLDAHWSPAQASAAFAEIRSRREVARTQIVHVEPRLSLTAAKANEWIPVIPDTEGALALGLAHVILKESLYDREFVEQYTRGLDDPVDIARERIGFRRLVLRDYSPSRVARITGVEEGTIFRLAREFASADRAVAIGYDGSGVAVQRTYHRMAIHALNALVGSIDVPGGVTHFQELPLGDLLTPPAPDPIAEDGLSNKSIHGADLGVYPLGDRAPRLVAERLVVEQPYAIDTLIVASGNPVFRSPSADRMLRALMHIPFVVSLSAWMDESSRWADLIVPDAHFLTRWDFDVAHTLSGHPTVTIGQAVVSGVGEGEKDTAELILEVARQLGKPVASALPFGTPKDVVRAYCDALHRLGRGTRFGSPEDEEWTRLLGGTGWRFPVAASADEFYQEMLASGGWTDPIYPHREWERVFRSPLRRFAFRSSVLAELVKPSDVEGDIRCLPHYDGPTAETTDRNFPLRLYVYPLPILAGLTEPNVPWLMDICGTYMSERWESWVEINPKTAHELHIADGDLVVVTSPRGKLTVRAKLFAGVRPDVLAMPWGLGHRQGGRWCAGIGENPADIVDVEIDPLTSAELWSETRVSVVKA